MKYKRLNPNEIIIFDKNNVTIKEMGNITELQYNSCANRRATNIKVDKNHYLNIDTGELLKYQTKSENRQQSVNSMRKTLKRISELVLTYVTDVKKVRWVTLTYRENMTDPKQLYNDFRKFHQRFQRYCKKNDYQKYSYICIAEPQGRGAFHLHIFFIWKTIAPFIPNDEFSKIWGHGFTKIQALKNTDNIAAYLMSYLSDIEIPEENKLFFDKTTLKETVVDGKKKYFIKGARLHMYPANFNIVRHSSDLKYPIKKHMSYAQAMNLVKNKNLTYQTAFSLTSEDNSYSSIIVKREYKNN